MVHRRDGMETRAQLLRAAAEVFAEKGYSDALVAEICERAGANVAAVNYHFGGKEALYREVWQHLGEESQDLYPVTGGAGPETPVDMRLRAHIHALLQRMTDHGRLGCLHRLYEHERSRPTGLIDDVVRRLHEPSLQVLQGVAREVLGAGGTEEQVRLAVFSILNQCRGVIGRDRRCKRFLGELAFTEDGLRRLAEHIARFSLGGLMAMRGRGPEQEDAP